MCVWKETIGKTLACVKSSEGELSEEDVRAIATGLMPNLDEDQKVHIGQSLSSLFVYSTSVCLCLLCGPLFLSFVYVCVCWCGFFFLLLCLITFLFFWGEGAFFSEDCHYFFEADDFHFDFVCQFSIYSSLLVIYLVLR